MFTLVFLSCVIGFQCEKMPSGQFQTVRECVDTGNAKVLKSRDTWGPHTETITILYNDKGEAVFFDKALNILLKFSCGEK